MASIQRVVSPVTGDISYRAQVRVIGRHLLPRWVAANYIGDKQPDCLRRGQHMDGRGRRLGTHRLNEERPALATIPKEPEPEIEALA